VGYYGAAPPQQPYPQFIQRPMVAPCPRCLLYHPPNQCC
jgi:TRIAD3 protein (E3 ubiquitin-protein ligase RNF216)